MHQKSKWAALNNLGGLCLNGKLIVHAYAPHHHPYYGTVLPLTDWARTVVGGGNNPNTVMAKGSSVTKITGFRMGFWVSIW